MPRDDELEVLQAIHAAVREEISGAGLTPGVKRQKSGRDR